MCGDADMPTLVCGLAGLGAPAPTRLFNLFWKSGSWQKRFTAECAEVRRGSLFYSASLCVPLRFFESSQKIIKSLALTPTKNAHAHSLLNRCAEK